MLGRSQLVVCLKMIAPFPISLSFVVALGTMQGLREGDWRVAVVPPSMNPTHCRYTIHNLYDASRVVNAMTALRH